MCAALQSQRLWIEVVLLWSESTYATLQVEQAAHAIVPSTIARRSSSFPAIYASFRVVLRAPVGRDCDRRKNE